MNLLYSASKLAALRPRFGSVGGGPKTGSGGKNDGGRPVAVGRGGKDIPDSRDSVMLCTQRYL
jgi:hypothetical protein